jgi:Flagellar hook-length control protein FliK
MNVAPLAAQHITDRMVENRSAAAGGFAGFVEALVSSSSSTSFELADGMTGRDDQASEHAQPPADSIPSGEACVLPIAMQTQLSAQLSRTDSADAPGSQALLTTQNLDRRHADGLVPQSLSGMAVCNNEGPAVAPADTLLVGWSGLRQETHHAVEAARLTAGSNCDATAENALPPPQSSDVVTQNAANAEIAAVPAALQSGPPPPDIAPVALQIATSITRELAISPPNLVNEPGPLERVPLPQALAQGTASSVVRAINFRLQPGDLGAVDVRMSISDGTVRLHLSFEHEKTAGFLDASHREITDALASSGLTVGGVLVDLMRAPGMASETLPAPPYGSIAPKHHDLMGGQPQPGHHRHPRNNPGRFNGDENARDTSSVSGLHDLPSARGELYV